MGDLKLIRNLQETYAIKTNLAICIIDKFGHPVLETVNTNALVQLVLDRYEGNFSSIMDELSYVNKGIIYDGLFGLKQLIVPIHAANDQLAYYIWAGILIEKGTKEHIINFLQEDGVYGPEWIDTIKQIPETEWDKKEAYLLELEQLAAICSTILQKKNSEEKLTEKLQLVNQIGEDANALDYGKLLESILSGCNELDFVGVAHPTTSERFEASQVVGRENVELIKNTFTTGEGFLGQAAVRGIACYWENIQSDPRSGLFLKGNARPNYLFCLPIYQNNKISSILFGGSYETPIHENTKQLLAIIKQTVELQFENKYLLTRKDNLLVRLTTLLEVSQILTGFEDKKRVLFTLVDMSLNLVQGPFACVIVKEEDGKANVVSRGLSSEQLQSYGKTVTERFLKNNKSYNEISSPGVYTTDWDVQVLEIPIIFRESLIGVLCVALTEQQEAVELQTLLSSLVLMAAVALHHQDAANPSNEQNKIVRSLHISLKQWNLNGYSKAVEAEKLATSFARFLGYAGEEINEISAASLLVYHDAAILLETGLEEKVVKLVKEYQEQRTTSSKSEILIMVYQYLVSGSINEITYNSTLNKQFKDFINKTQVFDEAFDLSPKQADHHEQRVADILDSLQKAKLLTSREVDVLQLIIQGLNNREIADQLFISEHTVKNHVTNIFQKLGVQDRTQAITFVYQGGQKTK